MKRLTFNAAMEQFREQFPRIETDPDLECLPEDLMGDTYGPMPWDEDEAEDAG